MIELSGIKKSYSRRCVLDVDSFVFEKGLKYALIGANGSGKSTLLRILAETLKPDFGTVVYSGGFHSDTGYMPQQPYSYGFSVLKNVMIAVKSRENAKRDALEALRRVGMEEFADKKGNRLSGGETQRMALARMIAVKRPLLLLDEPTSATDIAANDCIEAALKAYCNEVGATLIFSTHSPAQAQRVADMVVFLDNGRIAEAGTTGQVLLKPSSKAARDFLRHWRIER